MIEVKILGRGGQGVVSASAVIASALFKEGYFSQAFPMYGVERAGGPARAFVRIDKKPIQRYDQVYSPYVMLVIDPSVLKEEIEEELKSAGLMIINTLKSPEEIKKEFNLKQTCVVKTINATKIALDTVGKPFSNVVIVGAFAGMTNLISLDSINDAITEIWFDKGEEVVNANQKLAKKGYEMLYCRTCKVKI
jgi:pyruvate ferredoxin oxidoreductase gamma subunit